MFDANMRHLRKGRLFFADVHCVSKESILYKNKVREGDVVFCKMLEDDHKNPLIRFYINNKEINMKEDCFDDNWLVYAGSLDEDGNIRESSFICNKSLKKARKIIKEKK